MEEAEADWRVGQLLADLASLADWFRLNDNQHWAEWVGQAAQQISRQDGNGLQHVLGAYGGMGSLNDSFLPPDMENLRSRVYDNAKALLTDLER